MGLDSLPSRDAALPDAPATSAEGGEVGPLCRKPSCGSGLDRSLGVGSPHPLLTSTSVTLAIYIHWHVIQPS